MRPREPRQPPPDLQRHTGDQRPEQRSVDQGYAPRQTSHENNVCTDEQRQEPFPRQVDNGNNICIDDQGYGPPPQPIGNENNVCTEDSGGYSYSPPRPVTYLDLAALAWDVYGSRMRSEARRLGWNRVEWKKGTLGFKAGLYERDGIRVVAYAGTDAGGEDKLELAKDFIVDIAMIPRVRAPAARRAFSRLLQAYGFDRHYHDGIYTLFGILASKLSSWLSPTSDSGLSVLLQQIWLNRVPPYQTGQALEFYERHNPEFVTGHSLGGALTKVVAMRHRVTAVAFNSPYMGSLRGTVPASFAGVISINAQKDPLSLLTREIGSLPHGKEIFVWLPPYESSPPLEQLRILRTSDYPSSNVTIYTCAAARTALHVRTTLYRLAGLHELSESIVEGAGTVCDSLGVDAENAVRFANWVQKAKKLLEYLGGCAGYHHSMQNLYKAMAQADRFRAAVANTGASAQCLP